MHDAPHPLPGGDLARRLPCFPLPCDRRSPMKKVILVLVLLVTIPVTRAFPGTEHHIKAVLVPEGSSGVTGFVQLTQLPHGGTNIHVIARGLKSGTVYASF